MRILFLPIRSISELYSFLDHPKAIISELFIQVFSSRSPDLTGASFKYYLISSGSLRSLVSKFSQVSSFISNSSRCFFIFSSFIFNSYGGSFKSSLPSLSYRFIRSFQSYRWFIGDLPKFAPYLS